MEQWPDAFLSCSQFRVKFFVAKNHLRSSSPPNLLLGSCFARSCSPRPSQRSKYTEGVALRMRICIAVQRLSRKCVQKKNTSKGVWPEVMGNIIKRSLKLLTNLCGYLSYLLANVSLT